MPVCIRKKFPLFKNVKEKFVKNSISFNSVLIQVRHFDRDTSKDCLKLWTRLYINHTKKSKRCFDVVWWYLKLCLNAASFAINSFLSCALNLYCVIWNPCLAYHSDLNVDAASPQPTADTRLISPLRDCYCDKNKII